MTEIKASQRAREAAATMWSETWQGRRDGESAVFREGCGDDGPIVQAFARFEQAVRADERERVAKVVDRLESPDGILMAVRKNWSRRIAAAIRAQGGEA